MKPGVVLGGGKNARQGKVLVDSLTVYDWYLTGDQAARRHAGMGIDPLKKTSKKKITAWMWGGFPKDIHIGVNARGTRRWGSPAKFDVKVYKVMEAGRRRIAKIKFGNFGGVACGKVPYNRAKSVDGDADVPDIKASDLTADSSMDLDSGMDDLNEDMDLGQKFMLEITPLPKSQYPPMRSITFSATTEGVNQHRW